MHKNVANSLTVPPLFRKIIFSFLLIVLFVCKGISQNEQQLDSIEARFAATAPNFNHTQLYLHIDKSIYVKNEQVWFTGYLLSSSIPIDSQHTMYVFLSNRLNNKIVAAEKFVMSNGVAAGNIFIPDSVPTGDYNLLAYTNSFSTEYSPQPFQQQVNIREAKGDPFIINFEKGSTADMKGDSLFLVCRITNQEALYAKDARANYKILADDKVILSGKSIINQYGELPVRFAVPATARKFELITEITKDKKYLIKKMPIPFIRERVYFNWYPEGGDLISGIKTKMAFESTQPSGLPAVVSGMLMENGRALAKIQSNPAGLGVVEFIPNPDSEYKVKINEKDNVFIQLNFPKINKTGYTMRVDNGVIKDTIVLKIASSGTKNKIAVLVHDYQQIFQFTEINFENKGVIVKVPADILPRGLATITLLDSTGRPCAERTVFNGYKKIPVLQLTTDSTQYHTRSKVTLKLKALDESGNPLQTSFSLANVLSRRLDTLNYQDLVPYALFKNYVEQGLIPKPSMYRLGNTEQVEMFLLTRCWTRYRQPRPDTLLLSTIRDIPLVVSGKVIPKKKKFRLPQEITVLNEKQMNFIVTDTNGHFKLPPAFSEQVPEKKIQLIINDKHRQDYTIEMDQSDTIVSKALAARYYPEPVFTNATLPEEEKTILLAVKTLTAAVVKTKTANLGWNAVYLSKYCHDYVCMNNILNCRNHPTGGTGAVNGASYIVNGVLRQYKCEGVQEEDATLLFKVKGRYYTKDFYIADYVKFNPSDPELLTTVYWNPQVITNKEGEATITFYTNDLPGIFTCIAEGVTADGVISGKGMIKVVR